MNHKNNKIITFRKRTINYFCNFIIKNYFYKNNKYNYNANMNYNVKYIGSFFPSNFSSAKYGKILHLIFYPVIITSILGAHG